MIKRQIIDNSQYPTKCPYGITPKGISIHNNGNLNSTAQNERDNLNRKDNYNEVSFHYVTDKHGTIQCVDDSRNTWANGDYGSGWKSKEYLNWEICEKDYRESESQAIIDIVEVLKKYNWSTLNIKRHCDFSNKNCPSQTNKNWSNFLNRIDQELKKNSTSKKTYYVQVGAYTVYDNAVDMSNRLKEKGFPSFIKTE